MGVLLDYEKVLLSQGGIVVKPIAVNFDQRDPPDRGRGPRHSPEQLRIEDVFFGLPDSSARILMPSSARERRKAVECAWVALREGFSFGVIQREVLGQCLLALYDQDQDHAFVRQHLQELGQSHSLLLPRTQPAREQGPWRDQMGELLFKEVVNASPKVARKSVESLHRLGANLNHFGEARVVYKAYDHEGNLESVRGPLGLTPLIFATLAKRTHSIAHKLVNLGASTHPFSSNGKSALAFAIENQFYSLAQKFIRTGAPVDKISEGPKSIVDLLLDIDRDPNHPQAPSSKLIDTLTLLASVHPEVFLRGIERGREDLQRVFASGSLEAMQSVVHALRQAVAQNHNEISARIELEPKEIAINLARYTTALRYLEKLETATPEFLSQLAGYIDFQVSAGARKILRYARSCESACNWNPQDKSREPALFEWLPELIYDGAYPFIGELIEQIDERYDNQPELRQAAFHPDLPELLTLLQGVFWDADLHGMSGMQREQISNLSLAITSMGGFIDKGHPDEISTHSLKDFGWFGATSLSFKFWKEDSRSWRDANGERIERSSLFERFGFNRLSNLGSDLGPGFIISGLALKLLHEDLFQSAGINPDIFDDRTLLVMQRGALRASIPGVGTAVLGNLAPEFQRSLLPHIFYFSDRHVGAGMSEEQFKTLEARELRSAPFEHFLECYARDHEGSGSVARIRKSREVISALIDLYDAWRFESRPQFAWGEDRGEHGKLKGGYLSPGFPALLDYLGYRLNLEERGGEPAPALGFVVRGLPPMRTYHWTDHSGEVLPIFRLDWKRLNVLRALTEARGVEAGPQLQNTRNFLTEAGLHTGGRLVLL